MNKRGNKRNKLESSRKHKRQTWKQEEDNMLLQIVEEHGKEKWNFLSQVLNKRLSGCHKNGKQCRERYRNYLNPDLTKEEWSKNERALFALMHKHFGNRWGQIAKFYKGRSDISLKNLFYSQIRKALKYLKHGKISKSMAKKPQKVYLLYYILDIIRSKYLPNIDSSSSSSDLEKSEKIILGIIKDKGISKECVEEFQKRLLNEFVKIKGTSIIKISSKDLELKDHKIAELDALLKQNAIFPLSKYITIALEQIAPPKEPDVKLTPAIQIPQPLYPMKPEIHSPQSLPPISMFSQFQLMQILKDSIASNGLSSGSSFPLPFPQVMEISNFPIFMPNKKQF